MKQTVLKVAIALGATACAARAEFRPVTVTSAKPAAELYKSAVRVLADHGSGAATNDVAAGVVVGEYQPAEVMGTQFRYRWRVVVDAGSARVDSDCQFLNVAPFTGATEWKRCANQPEERLREAHAIAAEIAAR